MQTNDSFKLVLAGVKFTDLADVVVMVDKKKKAPGVNGKNPKFYPFKDFFQELKKVEEGILKNEPKISFRDLVTKLRKIYYDTPHWDILIPDAKASAPKLDEEQKKRMNDFELLRLEDEPLTGILMEFRHVLAGLDAILHPAVPNVSILGSLVPADNRNISTWSGELGSVVYHLHRHGYFFGKYKEAALNRIHEAMESAPPWQMMADVHPFALAERYYQKQCGLRRLSDLLEDFYCNSPPDLKTIYTSFIKSICKNGEVHLSSSDLSLGKLEPVVKYMSLQISEAALYAGGGMCKAEFGNRKGLTTCPVTVRDEFYNAVRSKTGYVPGMYSTIFALLFLQAMDFKLNLCKRSVFDNVCDYFVRRDQF